MPNLDTVKEQAITLVNDVSETGIKTSLSIVGLSLAVTLGDIIEKPIQDGLNLEFPHSVAKAHEFFDIAVGQYCLKGYLAASAALIGSTLLGRLSDNFRPKKPNLYIVET